MGVYCSMGVYWGSIRWASEVAFGVLRVLRVGVLLGMLGLYGMFYMGLCSILGFYETISGYIGVPYVGQVKWGFRVTGF